MTKRRRATRFRAHKDYIYFTGIKRLTFENEFLRIEPTGRVTVREGFISDGNSPTYKLPFSKVFQFGWVIGPPNGPRDLESLPISARAFFLHDALLDYVKDVVDIDRIHAEFCREINLTDWRWKGLACWLVCKMGPKK